LQTTQIQNTSSVPKPQTLVIIDNQAGNTSWLVGVNTSGILTTTLVDLKVLPGYNIPPSTRYGILPVGVSNGVLLTSGAIDAPSLPLTLNTDGATLIVGILASKGGPAVLTDSLSNDFQTLPAYTDSTTRITVQVVYAYNPIAQGNPDTFTLQNQNESAGLIFVFAGTLQASGVFDVIQGIASLLPSPFQPGPLTPQSGDVLLSGFATPSFLVSAPAVNDGFEGVEIAGSSGTANVAAAYKLNAAPSPINPTWTASSKGVPFSVGFISPSTSIGTVTGPVGNSYQMVSLGGGKLWNLEVTSLGVLQVVSAGNVGRSPQVYLRWSDDGGHNWSNYYALPFGNAGSFQTRVIWRRLGRSRNRVYEVSCTDPVPFRIVDAYLKASGEFQPQERAAQTYRKVA
jgi:hypothetical protein